MPRSVAVIFCGVQSLLVGYLQSVWSLRSVLSIFLSLNKASLMLHGKRLLLSYILIVTYVPASDATLGVYDAAVVFLLSWMTWYHER